MYLSLQKTTEIDRRDESWVYSKLNVRDIMRVYIFLMALV